MTNLFYLLCCTQLLSCVWLFLTPCSSAVRFFQARRLKRVTVSSSRVVSSQPRDQTHISCVGRWTHYHCTTWCLSNLRPNSILGRPSFYWYNINNIFTFLKLNRYCVLSVTWFLPPRSWSRLEERRLIQEVVTSSKMTCKCSNKW